MAKRNEQVETLIYLRNIMFELNVLIIKMDNLIATSKQHDAALLAMRTDLRILQETTCPPTPLIVDSPAP